ncbi:MAG TPA: Bax inhibitor-1/YccA family protein [Caulobacteraceae bacterium]|nr:Bax inhibitor-1/YccA family protein [Caulobacteraceae bacterium]
MSDFNRGHARPVPGAADMSVDVGLRAFMLGVYNKVALGLVLSGVLAFITSSVPPVRDLLFQVTPDGRLAGFTILGWIVGFAPLAILLFSGFSRREQNPRSASMLYWTIVALIGASLGTVLLRYTGESVASTFFITAAAFGSLSLFGYTTKRDLTGMGSFLMIGLIGLIVAMIVNIFVMSSMMAFIISALGVLIFAGLTAYDTQRLKMTYYELGGNEAALGVATSFGALKLYLDFINLFQFLLHFLGNRE